MERREFFSLTAAALGGAALNGTPADAAQSVAGSQPSPRAGVGIVTASEDQHRRRLRTIAECNQSIRKCMRKHLILDYLAAHAMYNLGEYPALKPYDPGEEDERNLDELRANGVQVVQVHEEWNDSQRRFGGDKFSAANEAGFMRFVDMVHARGMKVLAYISTGYFERTDPDFRAAWARTPDLVEIYFRYAGCSPVSPGWRAYVLPRIFRVMEAYRLDGIYNDLGQRPLYHSSIRKADDDVLAFEESRTYDGALADLLGIIYSEVKRRGGIVKLHSGGASSPSTGSRVYDYLWVGEAVNDADGMREKVKNHDPYVVPCLDMSRARIDREDDLYLQGVPYMQFPQLLAGRPFTGERASVPGIRYPPEEKDFWTRHCRNIYRHYQAHPQGPYSYGWWDSSPGRPEARPTYFRWLKQYLPMVTDGTWAYLEISDSDLFTHPLPETMVASVFANTERYLVLANYAQKDAVLETKSAYVPCAGPDSPPARKFTVAGRQLRILRKAGAV